MPAYQPGIPTGTVFLSIDYKNILNNFTALNDIFQVDHVALDANTRLGFHQSVHLISQSVGVYPPTPPATVANVGQVFSASVNDGYGTGTALFFLSGGGNLRQLTSNITPVQAQNGYTFLPGGIVMQWGIQALDGTSSQTGTTLFATANRNFGTACFNVQLTLISRGVLPGPPTPTNSSNNSLFIVKNSVSTTQFQWKFNGGSNDFDFFFWTAIGQ